MNYASALTNCLMMEGIPPEQAGRLSWWEYQAILWNVNDRRTPEGETEVDAPDADVVARRFEKLAQMGLVRSVH